MPLATGNRLGPYEIVAPIGAGGMGEVYRARDTRLERTVAIKVLPPHLADSPEFRQRFEREARSISQLSHPNVCALYDVGNDGGREFLVMEYLEGETLAARLAKGALPLEQSLRYGAQIAQALDAAHRRGIVHRDLKPANVMLTKSGVKLLDFGLATSIASSAVADGLTAAATSAGVPAITEKGAVLGTFQYMSPEQIEGREADARSDIFAFGTVLYEMATGAKAFTGPSRASLISAILRDEPAPISQVQPMTPPALDRVVRTCLAKSPDDRWQNAHDLASELEWIRQSDSGSGAPLLARGTPPGSRASGSRRSGLLRSAAAFGAILAATAAGWLLHRPARTAGTLHASILAPEGTRFDLLAGPAALSPDGTRVVFPARNSEGKTFLYVRPLDSDSAQPLAGTEGGGFPFWSPDGRSIAFSTGNMVAIVPAAGGVAEKAADLIRTRIGSWASSGVLVLGRGSRQPLVRFSVAGKKVEPASVLGPDDIAHISPQFLPDGRHFLYLARRIDRVSRTVTGEIRVGTADSLESRTLFPAESNVLYGPPGYLFFLQEGNLVARPFDAGRLALTGEPVVIARHVATADERTVALASISQTGRLVWTQGGEVGLSQLTLFDLEGKRVGALGEAGDVWTPRLSHDGRRVAVEIMDRTSSNRDIWIYDLARPSLPVRFTFDPGDMATPIWSPDDSRIAYLRRDSVPDPSKPAEWSMRVKSARGEGAETSLYSAQRTSYLTSWSPDGSLLAFNRSDPKTRNDVAVISTADRKVRVLAQTTAEDRDAAFSPDGRWIAYMSGASGRFEVYVQPFPGPGGKWQISTAGGNQPRWRPDGKALFYVTLDGRLMMVPVRTAPSFEAEEPRALFSPAMRRTLIPQYDVLPDGQRLLINSLAASDVAETIQLIENWPALLDGKR